VIYTHAKYLISEILNLPYRRAYRTVICQSCNNVITHRIY